MAHGATRRNNTRATRRSECGIWSRAEQSAGNATQHRAIVTTSWRAGAAAGRRVATRESIARRPVETALGRLSRGKRATRAETARRQRDGASHGRRCVRELGQYVRAAHGQFDGISRGRRSVTVTVVARASRPRGARATPRSITRVSCQDGAWALRRSIARASPHHGNALASRRAGAATEN